VKVKERKRSLKRREENPHNYSLSEHYPKQNIKAKNKNWFQPLHKIFLSRELEKKIQKKAQIEKYNITFYR